MKKILAVIMSALLILTAFAACSRSGEGNNTAQGMTESAANAKYKVYLITIDKMDQHWVSAASSPAFTFSVSKVVSNRTISTPPSTKASTCSL